MNPRYIAYCNAHGKSPDEMLKLDRLRFPGGVMCGFILWMKQKRAEFRLESPQSFFCGGISDMRAWDEFLSKS